MGDKLSRVAIRTSLGYAFFAGLWIALSGKVLLVFIHDAHALEKIEMSKGWAFVALTAFLLYVVLHRQMRWLGKEAEARRQAETLVREVQERFAAIFRSSPMAITLSRCDDGRLVDVNPAALDIFGYRREELMNRPSSEMGVWASPEYRNKLVEVIRTRGRVEGVEIRFRRKSGEEGIILGSAELLHLSGDDYLLSIGLDVTDKKRAEEALKESESRFRSAFETSAIGMALVGLDGRWLKVNRSLCESFGYQEEELLERAFREITHPDDLDNDDEHMKRLIHDELPYYHMEKRCLHRDGYALWVLLCVSMVRDAKGYPLYFVYQIEDITERKLLDEKLRTALISDELTGLLNRRGFLERCNEASWSAPRRGETIFLSLVKIDDMKRINDTIGQKEGDAIITDVGRMLRETFPEPNVIGRIGGVEFAILATGSVEIVERLTAQLEHAVFSFKNGDGRDYPVPLSVGTALGGPQEAPSFEELIGRANGAMVREKERKAPKSLVGIL
ncbi:MAG TPA: PAS domain S-box protein [Syntrophorhabdales bacterium]|nr:PAS domain S-box protein [Syntrophorhabdales bacterium]